MAKKKKNTGQTEQPAVEAVEVKEEKKEEQVDEKTKVLLSFKNFMETSVKNTYRTSSENGYRILEFYNKYTGRQERWTGCASCVSGKFHFLLGECKKKNITINV